MKAIRRYAYIDAFAGAGEHISRTTESVVPGSPLVALEVQPPFSEYHFIDLDGRKMENLQKLTAKHENVTVYPGDCNEVLLKEVFPRLRYSDFRRGLCLLDPYGLHLDWQVMYTAGQMESIEIFLNFMVMDMNMNVLKRDTSAVTPVQAARMTRFWGDESWREVAYTTEEDLWGYETKRSNEYLAQGFRERLQKVAGFKCVPEPIPMRNSSGAVVYYLFFASPNSTGSKIVNDIFQQYRNRGMR